MKYQIIDWTGKVCFHGVLFDSFDDAWGYIYENDPAPNDDDDDHYDDYQVIEVD